MAKLNIQSNQLENGLKIVKIHLPSFHSATNFLTIRSGSRYENKNNNGIAHFLEHMVFKGTEKYPDTKTIAEVIEGVGGYFNAWTNVDHTAYWNTVPSAQWQIGVELPFQLAFRALLRPEDLERERGVITEEIRMIQDDPARYVDDLSGELVFAGNGLGQQNIGPVENIKKMTIQQFIDYRETYYAPSQSLFIAIGDVEGKDYQKLVADQVKGLERKTVTLPDAFTGTSKRALKLLSKKTDQTHFMLSMAEPSFSHLLKDRFVGAVLNAILGRGMSSRLFLNVREKRGLAYAIHSSLTCLEDTGLISIYGGVNTDKITEALAATEHELTTLTQEKVGADELAKAKAQIMGSYDLRSDDPIRLAQWYGTDHLLGMTESYEEAKAAVSKVTAEQIQALARKIFDKERLTLAVIGPYQNDGDFRKFLEI